MAGLQTLDPKDPEALHDIGQSKGMKVSENSLTLVHRIHRWLVENR